VSAEVDEENRHWEIQQNGMMALLIAAAGLMVLALTPAIGFELSLPESLTCAAGTAYFLSVRTLLRRRIGPPPEVLRWISATMEATLGTIAIVITLIVKGPLWAVTSPTLLIYGVALVCSSIRIRPRLTFYATLVAVSQYLAVYYVGIRPRLPDTALASTLRPWAAWERSFWLVMIGGVVAFATRHVRRTLYGGGVATSERRWVEQQFGRFVSRDVAGAVLRGAASTPARLNASVLFCDLRDFTALCEREAPEAVLEMLNTFYTRVCRIVDDCGGHVNKFLGDGVLAIFGAPEVHHRHAEAAATVADRILAAADELRLRGGTWAHFRVGIGIDTGDVVAGIVGAEQRQEYTAIGRTVNRAARLQALAKHGREIVLSDTCARELGPRQDLVSLGEIAIKGFSTASEVFVLDRSKPG
jgi:adenylate cyclase